MGARSETLDRTAWRLRSPVAAALLAALLASLLVPTSSAEAVTDPTPSFEVIPSDLEHILKQIKISERHADGHELLCEDPLDDSGVCIPDPRLPWGVRTVDGSFNNLIEGQQHFGSADQNFRRLLPTTFRAGEPRPDGAPGAPGPTHYSQTAGFVYDSQPRVVSNLIVDLTTDNPAAVAVAEQVDGSETAEDGRIFIPNVSPDEGLSAPFNTWMTFFGQFFDHGLDLVNKGGSGTVVIPLKPDDPLFDPDSNTNFLMLTRATNRSATEREHNNQTTPFVDQNQTYTSHPSHQVFLREYTANGDATGHLLDGADGGLATWADVKAQALAVLGVQLTNADVLNVPLLRTDPYGNAIFGPNGNVQYATPDGFVEADGGPVPANALRTNHAFLDDIAHTAAPVFVGPADARQLGACAETDDLGAVPAGSYDCGLLEDHFITGDGRGNENLALTAVHHIFHAEHNRLAGHIEDILDAPENAALKARYQNEAYAAGGLKWSYGQRLFQAARFVTEMEYQHLVFEEFARTIQPEIDVVPLNESGYHTDIDASITAEFAHVVYRFGHSMLTETVHRDGFGTEDVSLLDAFLTPRDFTMGGQLTPEQAAGSLVTGAVANPGSGIDEFVTETLRNELLGLPLDLAVLNIARGRDTGVPPLQTARRTFFEQTGDLDLKPYANWEEFGLALKHPESLVNFVAAYGTHADIVAATTVDGKRDAAQALLDADDAFLRQSAATSGLDDVDFWMGGIAEAGIPFGGMLGTTFNFVFETQLEDLQFGDRFYYLSRNIGMNLFHQLEANSFSAIAMRTTDATLLPAEIFQTPDLTFDLNEQGPPPPAWWAESGFTRNAATGEWRFVGGEHINVHGTSGRDLIRGGIGDDALWGYGGDDDIIGGPGANAIVGGPGRDVLYGLAGEDNIKGGAGNDAINGGAGPDLLLGGSGSDFIAHNSDPTTSFGGTGNDFILGGAAHDVIAGNEGDDWLEGGPGSDLVQGDNANGFQDDPNGGHDVLSGGTGNDDMDAEGGDDIMLASAGVDRFEGMLGFDWVTHRGQAVDAVIDMDNTVFQPPAQNNFRDRYDLVEGVSGWHHNDQIRGRSNSDGDGVGHELTTAHLNRVTGLRDLLGGGQVPPYAEPFTSPSVANDILLGGRGSDLFEGRGGDDFIDGSAWLNVQLEAGGLRYDSLTQVVDPARGSLQTQVFNRSLDPGDIRIVRSIVFEQADESVVNTAVYSGPRDEYTVVLLDEDDGTFRVTHIDDGPDGSDVLRNVQRLNFAGDVVDVADLLGGDNPTNTPVTGTVTISDPTPREGDELTATSDLVDPDGIDESTLLYTWQMETDPDVWVSVVTAPTGPNDSLFTPDDPEVGRRLRVVASFVDGQGVLESLASEPTEPVENVNDAPTGQPTLSTQSPVIGQPITASTADIVDADGTANATFAFQWQQNNTSGAGGFGDIVGATSATFTPTDAQAGRRLRVVVSYTDDHGTAETVISEPTVDQVVGSAVVSLPATTDFGLRRIGQVRTQNVRLVNTGTAPLAISGVTTSGAPFTANLGNCPASLPIGRQCNLSVSFTPTEVGAVTRTLTVTSNASNGPTTVQLTGTGRN